MPSYSAITLPPDIIRPSKEDRCHSRRLQPYRNSVMTVLFDLCNYNYIQCGTSLPAGNLQRICPGLHRPEHYRILRIGGAIDIFPVPVVGRIYFIEPDPAAFVILCLGCSVRDAYPERVSSQEERSRKWSM